LDRWLVGRLIGVFTALTTTGVEALLREPPRWFVARAVRFT